MSKKKKKLRVSFRKNRQARTRESGLTKKFEQHGFEDDDSIRREQLSGKGELAKKRTVVGEETTGDTSGFKVLPEVDLENCLSGRVLEVRGLVSVVQTSDGQRYNCALRRLLKTLETDQRHVVAVGDEVQFRPDGEEGLIERIEPRSGVLSRSSRDRQHVLRIPWRLKDLHSRGVRLQAQRLQQSLDPLDELGLAASLNVSPQRWREALIAHSFCHVDSLDVAPSIQSVDGELRSSLINQIEDPSSVPALVEEPTLRWLKDAMMTLEPQQCCWLLARYVDNISIKDLALRDKVDAGLLRQSIRESLSRLRQAARPLQQCLPLASKTKRNRNQHR